MSQVKFWICNFFSGSAFTRDAVSLIDGEYQIRDEQSGKFLRLLVGLFAEAYLLPLR